MTANRALLPFRIAIAAGLVVNLVFALPALLAPRAIESMFDVGATNTPSWLQNVGILLVIVSTMYVPVILDPFRYLFVSILAVAARFSAGVLFLVGRVAMDYPAGFSWLSGNDLVLSAIQAVLLWLVLRGGDPRRAEA